MQMCLLRISHALCEISYLLKPGWVLIVIACDYIEKMHITNIDIHWTKQMHLNYLISLIEQTTKINVVIEIKAVCSSPLYGTYLSLIQLCAQEQRLS